MSTKTATTCPGTYEREQTSDVWASVPRSPIRTMIDTQAAWAAAIAIKGAGGWHLIAEVESAIPMIEVNLSPVRGYPVVKR